MTPASYPAVSIAGNFDGFDSILYRVAEWFATAGALRYSTATEKALAPVGG